MSITALPVAGLVELPRDARLRPEPQLIQGRAFAAEHAVATVWYRIDEGPLAARRAGLPQGARLLGCSFNRPSPRRFIPDASLRAVLIPS